MRRWLWNALCQVVLHQTYSNLYLKDHLSELDEKDRKLATHIFYGTLQNWMYCQWVWKQYAKGKVSPRLRVLLTMSVYQLLFLDKVPSYAIIDEAVHLARTVSTQSAGFVNAVLRKVVDTPIVLPEDEQEAFALKHSMPLWLYKMWIAHYGKEQADAMASSSTSILPVYVRANPLAMPKNGLPPRFEKVDEDLYIYKGETLFKDPFFKEGKVSAMDKGSYAIARYGEVKPGMKVLDLCAAPGTKTMAMKEMMNDEGEILALDIHPHRVSLIEKDAKRLHLHDIHAKAADSAKEHFEPEYDFVLCDVPCSGYGVLARKPDLKLKITGEEMDSLLPLQAALLENGSTAVKEGGRLVYSTCTINKKENEKQVEAFLKRHPEFTLEKMQTLFPDETQDGFFMARLLKEPGHTEESAGQSE